MTLSNGNVYVLLLVFLRIRNVTETMIVLTTLMKILNYVVLLVIQMEIGNVLQLQEMFIIFHKSNIVTAILIALMEQTKF